MKFYTYLTEQDKIAKSVSDGIYNDVKNVPICAPAAGGIQCHSSVQYVKKNAKDNWWYKFLKFIEWKELNWKKVSEKLIKINAYDKFKNKHIKNLIMDISDFSVNGHSLMKFKDYYIDPYLRDLKVPDKEIQKFGKFWEKII